MSMFANAKASSSEQSLEQLIKTLSDNQLKVARQNYRRVMQDLTVYMDISDTELKDLVSRKVIERIKIYEM